MTLKINDNLINQVAAVQLDCGTGSMITDITMRRYGDILPNPFIRNYYELAIIFNPSYEPTYAALDLVNVQVDNLTGDIVSFERSKFDDYVVQQAPLQHHELSEVTRNKIVEWLNRYFNITVNYNLLEGGSVSPDVCSVRILHGTSITVPPKTVNVNGQQITYVFSNWEDGSTQNPRTFYASHNVSHTATLKAHLASSSSQATATTSQRKVVSDGCCSYAVYSSAGAIWFTKNSGSGWSPEVMLSPISNAKNPSISWNYPAGQSNLHVVWENTVTDLYGNPRQAVFYRRSTNGGTTWESPIGFYNFPNMTYTGNGIDATPVVGGSPATVVWKYGSASSGGFVMRVEPALNSGYYPVPNTFPSCRMPSLDGQTTHKLVYENGGQIMYWEFSINSQNYSVTPIGWPTGISGEYPWMFNSTNPSISTAYPYVFVSWEADRAIEEQDKENPINPHRVFVRGYAPWVGWAPVTEFDYYSQTEQNSSVGIDRRLGYGKVNVAWDCSGGDVVKSRRDISGVQWSGINVIGQGKYPTLEYFVSLRPSYAMYTTGSAPPFSISLNNSFSSLLDQGSKLITMGNGEMFPIELPNRSRAGSVRLDSLRIGRRERGALSGNLWVRSAAFVLSRGASREPIPFSQDTLNFSEWLGTESIVVPQDAQRIEATLWLTLRNFAVVDRNLPGGTRIVTTRFEVENGSHAVVKSVLLSDIKRYEGLDTTLAIPISIPALPLRGKTLRLRQNLVGQEDAQQPAWSELIRIDSVTSNSIQNRLFGKGGSETPQAIPTEFAVHEGYPNPFNPNTTIKYDLPKPSHVSLIIYDVLGRKVVELENGVKEAGYHSATWDASDVASGVYFARFIATDANGNVKLNKVSKLLLAK